MYSIYYLYIISIYIINDIIYVIMFCCNLQQTCYQLKQNSYSLYYLISHRDFGLGNIVAFENYTITL